MDSIFALLGAGASFDSRRFQKDTALVKSKPNKESGEQRQEAGDKRRGDEPSARSKARKRHRGLERTASPSDVQVFSRTVTAGGTFTGGEESSDNPESHFVRDDTVVNTRDPHEEANVLRKQHRIKVTGSGVPPPLRSFADVAKVCSAAGLDCLGKQEGPALLRRLLENLVAAGFLEPTPIQRQAVPCLLAGAPLLAIAPTGSGKTLAFVLPCLLRVLACKLLRSSQKRRKPPPHAADAAADGPAAEPGLAAVLLCPTRELAGQTMRVLQQLTPGLGIRAKLVSKASTDASNIAKVDVLVSTPMRLVAAVQAGQVPLAGVRMLVLDEADKLLELGMLEQVDELMAAATHPTLTRALFSATIPSKVEELARSVMHDPVRVTVGVRNTAAASIHQKLLFTGSEEGKLLALRQMVSRGVLPPVLVFVASKDRAQSLHREMKYDGLRAACIHADQTQAARNAAVERFRAGDTWMLIATDLLGRGMDFLGVSTVINYDLPRSAGDYIHRIGRTGRAGKSGEAVTFFTEDDADRLRPIVNTMREAGCSVPDWMLQLPKSKRTKAKSRKKPA